LRRLGVDPIFTDKAAEIRAAERVILPGVGAAGQAMEILGQRELIPVIQQLRQPVLGICLGMQLLFESSEEDNTQLLGLIPGRLKRLQKTPGLRVPHMGWNAITNHAPDSLTEPLDGEWFYFVHSYAVPVSEWTLSTCTHGSEFAAIVRKDNFFGAQFHPERSAGAGNELLSGFLETPPQ
jgi:glutamine amidotransferase